MKLQLDPATPQQINYIEILLNDVQVSYNARTIYLSQMHQREIKYLDQLTKKEASTTINELKRWKETLTARG